MAAPLTSSQINDLYQFKVLAEYISGILDREAALGTPTVTAGNITELNDTLTSTLTNIQTILTEWATPAP